MSAGRRLIFIHGLEGTSQGVKAKLLREQFPGILTPDFRGTLEERMVSLRAVLGEQGGWTIIGSSFGGLMAAVFACERPQQVEKLVLLAPALIWPDFANALPAPVDIPTVIYHGTRDEHIPLEAVRKIAAQVFTHQDFRAVDDDHGLYQTVHEINWDSLIND
jgi:pimeloyl-ACP methyl ester carboxylesterase